MKTKTVTQRVDKLIKLQGNERFAIIHLLAVIDHNAKLKAAAPELLAALEMALTGKGDWRAVAEDAISYAKGD